MCGPAQLGNITLRKGLLSGACPQESKILGRSLHTYDVYYILMSKDITSCRYASMPVSVHNIPGHCHTTHILLVHVTSMTSYVPGHLTSSQCLCLYTPKTSFTHVPACLMYTDMQHPRDVSGVRECLKGTARHLATPGPGVP